MNPPLLEVINLNTLFETPEGKAPVVHDVSFRIERGETLGLVGESGSGKSVTALSIMRLVQPPGRIVSGEIRLNGEDILGLSESEMRKIRGKKISMVFQDPMNSLNPVFSIGAQIMEVVVLHEKCGRNLAYRKSIEILHRVGIPDPQLIASMYPHQLSGGMRQRAMIAMCLVSVPNLLIADEPTTAIDVTVQVQILELINRLKKEFGMGMLVITHDLGVVAESCDRVAVMYASHIVEAGSVREIFSSPRHPYTIGLLTSLPGVHHPKERLSIIPGQVPRPQEFPAGCHFAPRCSYATDICREKNPQMEIVDDSSHLTACWNWKNVDYTPISYQPFVKIDTD